MRSKLFFAAGAAALALTAPMVAQKAQQAQKPKLAFMDANAVAYIRPGVKVKIVSASIAKDGTITARATITDPKGWDGEMKFTKRWNRVDDQDIQEVSCLPDLNQHIPSTQSKDNVR